MMKMKWFATDNYHESGVLYAFPFPMIVVVIT